MIASPARIVSQQEIYEIWTENIDENITKEQLNELFLGYETKGTVQRDALPEDSTKSETDRGEPAGSQSEDKGSVNRE